MSADDQIAVSCVGCGQVCHVTPPKEDQRAQCRGCGRQFVITATVVGRRSPSPRPTGEQSASEYHFSQSLATKLGDCRRVTGGSERDLHARASPKRWLVALGVIGGVALAVGVVSVSTYRAPTRTAAVEHLERGRVARLAAPNAGFAFATLSDLIEAVEPAIVQVETATGVGSGFVIHPDGLIVTCHHCVAWSDEVKVVFADRREMQVIGIRALSPSRDLAILQVQAGEPLEALALAGNAPRKGEPVVAFGSPAGLSFTVSEGAVSARRSVRDISQIVDRLRGGGGLDLSMDCELVQFTATAMPGHSGGPVVDFRGNVVGLTAFGLPYQGRSFEFAISFSEVRLLAERLDHEPTPLPEVWERELARRPVTLEVDSPFDDSPFNADG